MGSKSKITQFIVPIIQRYIDENNINTYIEPFVGGANVIDKIQCKIKIGYDKNKYLIALLNNVEKVKEFPITIEKSHYDNVRNSFNTQNKEYEDWYIGAIGFLASYNGRFFDGGYAKTNYAKQPSGHIVVRNYFKEAKENLTEQIPRLYNIKFESKDYTDLHNIKNSLIYCDPPYQNTKQYGVSKNFNYEEFWQWVRDISKNNIVIVSECTAPDDFKCIWQQEITRTVDNTKRVKAIEKLFIYTSK
jgi:DNA adenine methylase